ncbi:MAG TPA: hypothetical protein VNM39_13170 [Verrucomicrobiae bacterium]|nr:hypothetical protein [Verrucomicrobiae bacterium]
MSRVRVAVLELTSALHNWRTDPSPANAERVVSLASVVSGFALEFERILETYGDETKEPPT